MYGRWRGRAKLVTKFMERAGNKCESALSNNTSSAWYIILLLLWQFPCASGFPK